MRRRSSTVISFVPNPPVEAIRIIELVQKNRHIKLAGNDKLRIERELADPRERAQLARDVLRSLGAPKPPAAAAAPKPAAADCDGQRRRRCTSDR